MFRIEVDVDIKCEKYRTTEKIFITEEMIKQLACDIIGQQYTAQSITATRIVCITDE